MTLNYATETIHTVSSYDLEEFILENYPDAEDYSFVADMECGNDSTHSFDLDGSPPDE